MLRDKFESVGSRLCRFAGEAAVVLYAMVLFAALVACLWLLIKGLDLSDNQVVAVVCGAYLTDSLMRWRRRRKQG